MYQSRTVTSIGLAETQSLRQTWLRSNRCVRCFHNSRPRRADEQQASTEKEVPYNAPNRGPSRQERAAKISSEISAIAKGPPPPDTRDRANAAASQSSNATLASASPPAETQEKDSEQAAALKSLDLGNAEDEADNALAGKPSTVEAGSASTQNTAETQSSQQKRRKTPSLETEKYIALGQGTSTIAGANYKGVITDRMNLVGGPNVSTRTYPRDMPHIRQRLARRQFVKLQDRAELQRLRDNMSDKDPEKQGIAPVPKGVQEAIIDKLVLGKHDKDGIFEGKQVYKQPLLNELSKATLLNGSYLAKDRQQFLTKVRSLLPLAPRPGQKAQKTVKK